MFFEKLYKLIAFSDGFGLLITKSLGLFLKLLHPLLVALHLAQSTLDLGLGTGDDLLGRVRLGTSTTKFVLDLLSFLGKPVGRVLSFASLSLLVMNPLFEILQGSLALLKGLLLLSEIGLSGFDVLLVLIKTLGKFPLTLVVKSNPILGS